jgi:hypothetical protein
MMRLRSLSAAGALVLLLATIAVVASPSAVLAGGGSVPGGNCEAGSPSGEYCSFFQADQGPPGTHAKFWMYCPKTQDFGNGVDVSIIDVEPIVTVANLGPNAPALPVTKLGHLNYGDPGYFSPPAGSTAWYSEVVIPNLPGYPAVLSGWGYCEYTNGEVHAESMNYFWVTEPTAENFVISPDKYFELSWTALFGSARLLGDQAFSAPTRAALPLGGPPVTTAKPKSPNPPSPTASTSTTTLTRPLPSTTTSTTRAGGRR